jgi:DNA-binding NtrC family response regulator
MAANAHDEVSRVIAAHVELQVQAATGDLVRIRQARDRAIAAARAARMPFRIAAARLIWIDAARRAGRTDDVTACLESLRRLRRVAPPLLQHEIERRLTPDARASSVPARVEPLVGHASFPAALLRLASEEDDDIKALASVLARISDQLHTSRIDVHSNAAGPPTLICSAGQGLPTRLGTRVLDAGFAIGPERQTGGWEVGLPVRFGSRMLGALVSRWPLDRDVPPDAAELLELAAVIAAPRVDALQSAARDAMRASTAVPELLGVSDAIASVRRAIIRAAAAPFNVLIEGETGVGKELAARAVHHLSARRERRFCDLNCAALPEELLESELFGHVRGAFSGAVTDRSGLFEDANGGTLFLDEVADLSSRAQAKLLRVVQQQEVRRVGESFGRPIDVRLVAAANRDMRAEAAAGRFRSDLLYRLDVVRIQIPPLRERVADIPVLAEHCWNAVTRRTGSKARLSAATLNELSRYHWPGNVREMQNVIASLALAAPARGWVRPAALPSIIGAATTVSSGRLADAREQFERRFVEVALARAAGNRARTARSLGVSRQGLLKILARLRLDNTSGRGESC